MPEGSDERFRFIFYMKDTDGNIVHSDGGFSATITQTAYFEIVKDDPVGPIFVLQPDH